MDPRRSEVALKSHLRIYATNTRPEEPAAVPCPLQRAPTTATPWAQCRWDTSIFSHRAYSGLLFPVGCRDGPLLATAALQSFEAGAGRRGSTEVPLGMSAPLESRLDAATRQGNPACRIRRRTGNAGSGGNDPTAGLAARLQAARLER